MQLHIKIILASIRENRFGDKPAQWILEHVKQLESAGDSTIHVEVLDLREYELPFFAEAVSPIYVAGAYGNPAVDRWAQKIGEADGYIIVTPEYNNGYPTSLKNNIDYLYKEWNNKPVCFVAYGSTGGARVVQQLREVAIELQMAPIRNSVHIMNPWLLVEENNALKSGALDMYNKNAENMLQQFMWWMRALKNAREEK